MKTLIATVLALTLLGGCCKTASTYKSLTPGCSPRAMAALDPCPPFVGPAGADGPCGVTAMAIVGGVGEDGPAGPRGADGGVIVGVRGAPGGPGAKGLSFAPPRGERGDAGPAGGRGDDITGPPGPRGNSGKVGASVAGIQGAKGRVGRPGEKGRVGQLPCWASYRVILNGDMSQIPEIAAYLRDTPSLDVGLDGSGAAAVRSALIEAGVSPNRIKTGDFGNAAYRSGNRVEVLLKSTPE